ncbi:MAG: hypothetical protein ABWY11_22210 [Umezawaea sp.]
MGGRLHRVVDGRQAATGDYGDAFWWAFAFTGLSFAAALLPPRQPAPKQTNPTLAE